MTETIVFSAIGVFAIVFFSEEMKFIKGVVFSTVILFIILLSTRQLSDPDLGFHLKYGRYIIENATFPTGDLSTYTVTGQKYTDLHWLFQVLIFSVCSFSGYHGLSVLLTLFSILILLTSYYRLRSIRMPLTVRLFLLLIFFLIIEVRIILRPEVFSFLFLSIILLILEKYYRNKDIRLLYFLPILMIVWTQMHALFILGLISMFIFLVSQWWRDKHPDLKLLTWIVLATIICVCNPYFLEGVLFPFRLLSRFSSGNIYHQHIAEFRSFFTIDRHTGVEYVFMFSLVLNFILYLLTIRKRSLHEILLLLFSTYLALIAVRNIPLFAVMNLAGVMRSLSDIKVMMKRNPNKLLNHAIQHRHLELISCSVLILMAGTGIFRVLNGSIYVSDRTNNQFGTGLNQYQIPEKAADFLLRNHLDGKIMNSLGTGGWLSWKIPQPVFIDGRLEVMNEALYLELMESWNGSLNCLIEKYNPKLVVYNYLKYFPWTHQLYQNPDWRLIYLDGLFAIWAENNYATAIPALSSSDIRASVRLSGKSMLQPAIDAPNKVKDWFLRGKDDLTEGYRNIGMFLLQGDDQELAEDLLNEVMIRTGGRDEIVSKALSEIKMRSPYRTAVDQLPGKGENLNKGAAKQFFNQGNELYGQKDLQGAIVFYSRAIRLDPGYCKAYNNRGNVYAILGNYLLAIKDFDSAINLDPAFADAYLGRGSCNYSLGNRVEAREDWEQAASLGHPKAEMMLQEFK
jgi:tetratricopeptide (TPR) repeat protein